MADTCQVNFCRGEARFTCFCNQNLKLCKDHLVDHFGIQGNHKKIDLEFMKIKLLVEEACNSLEAKRKEIQIQGRVLINEVLIRIEKIENGINQRIKELINLLNNGNYSIESEHNIGRLSKIAINTDINNDFIKNLDQLFIITEIQVLEKASQVSELTMNTNAILSSNSVEELELITIENKRKIERNANVIKAIKKKAKCIKMYIKWFY